MPSITFQKRELRDRIHDEMMSHYTKGSESERQAMYWFALTAFTGKLALKELQDWAEKLRLNPPQSQDSS